MPRGRARGLVPRPRLTERLDRGVRVEADAHLRAGRVRQVDARWPSGWRPRRAAGLATAWLSLDPGDNHPASFWTHVIAALQTRRRRGSARAPAPLLESRRPRRSRRPGRRCSTSSTRCRTRSCWCSTTTTRSTRREIQDGMAFLLDHLPAQRAPGDRHPRRPGAAARAAAGAGRAGRGPRRRPALHAGRGRGVPQRASWGWR